MAQRKVSCEVYTDRGIVGPKGDTGSPNSLSIGTVEDGETASATITGDAPNQVLNLVLPKGDKGDSGDDGQDGFSPTATVTKSGDTATISITDKNGTTTTTVSDGTDGAAGQDGYSPTATVTKSGSIATITITDKNGTTTATVSDGVGSVTDVQVDGVSVVSSGVANITGKQDTLVSGTNIKTVNSTSLLGSGDITIDSLPSQTGQSGKFLTTDGTDASWANVDALPSQTGQNGKFLTTNGTSASWADGTSITIRRWS